MTYTYHEGIESNMLASSSIALSQLIYCKALKLSQLARQRYTSGEISNLLSVEVPILIVLLRDPKTTICLSIKILFILGYLYFLIGWKISPCIVCIVIFSMINLSFAKKMTNCSIESSEFRNQRANITQTAITNAKAIKINALEDYFEGQIQNIREKELNCNRNYLFFETSTTSIFSIMPSIFLFLYVIMTYYEEKGIEPELLFFLISIFETFKESICWLNYSIKSSLNCIASFNNVKVFIINC